MLLWKSIKNSYPNWKIKLYKERLDARKTESDRFDHTKSNIFLNYDLITIIVISVDYS